MAVQTTYDGITYRSRLEARWAAFFWRIGWATTYEPFDGDGYLPDFLIHGARPLLIEVKPAVTPSEYESPLPKVTRGVAAHWKHDILVVGVDPLPPLLTAPLWMNRQAMGLLGQNVAGDGAPDWDFKPGLWITCERCNSPAIFHPEHDFTAAPCGHHDGDGHLGRADFSLIKKAWDAATNDVRWTGRAA